MEDTTIVKLFDSSTVIKNGNEHIILIQDLKKETIKDWYESPWISSLLIPILVAAAITWIGNILNRKKNKLEIDKLKAETSKLKKSFQPIVIGTLQSIQDKIIPDKIDALKRIVQLKNEFTHHEQQYYEGDPITPDFDEYLNLLFYNFSNRNYVGYCGFHDQYSYLFPDNVFNILKTLLTNIFSMNETKKSFDSMDDQEIKPGKKARKDIEEIIKLFNDAILAIRMDCHLDTSFIHDFIEQNKN